MRPSDPLVTDLGALLDDDSIPIDRVGVDAAKKTTPERIRLYLQAENVFAPTGDGAAAVAAHNMEQDPHTQYQLSAELPAAVLTLPPSDGKVYVMRNQQWEVLEII